MEEYEAPLVDIEGDECDVDVVQPDPRPMSLEVS